MTPWIIAGTTVLKPMVLQIRMSSFGPGSIVPRGYDSPAAAYLRALRPWLSIEPKVT
jgi:hypothetical protein